jgi:hypothetical protein
MNSDPHLRYYELQYLLEGIIQDLSGAEMKIGAFNIIAAMSGWLWNFHFNEKLTLNPKALVKTIDDVYTSACEEMMIVEKESGIQIFQKVENQTSESTNPSPSADANKNIEMKESTTPMRL